MELTVNPEFANRVIGHDKISKKVGDHTPDELKSLALLALQSNNRILKECFVNLPTLDALMSDRTATQITAIKAAATAPIK